ncbi:metalloregulator ArsR/SmtB family transcription factor [Amorphoplanes nipponensis]|uniref:Transcriptional regulator n=1 Tax=Actinoplanes nipponensis TaxID=135950 RepID=A0A919JN22_9ACTN|nr:metalloregulator ArsR/SmtB family transcription factor [Actinoplanes nipponensis]GIE53636.1 transcriptional regulator [Actinoplanes nipponensis]
MTTDRLAPEPNPGPGATPVLAQLTCAPPLRERDLMDGDQAAGIAGLFKVLANDTRLRLLHALARRGEVRVGDLAGELGMSQQAVSNQLQRLADQRILATRRAGTSIYYRIVDSCVPALLELGWCVLDSTGTPAAPAPPER